MKPTLRPEPKRLQLVSWSRPWGTPNGEACIHESALLLTHNQKDVDVSGLSTQKCETGDGGRVRLQPLLSLDKCAKKVKRFEYPRRDLLSISAYVGR